MSQLYNKIESHRLTARQNGQATTSSLLTTLVGEIQTKGKNEGGITDTMVLDVIKKFIKNTNELLVYKPNHQDARFWLFELAVLENYLPKQLSDDDIRDTVYNLIDDGMSNQGQIMKYFKENHNAQYDARVLSEIAKHLLATH